MKAGGPEEPSTPLASGPMSPVGWRTDQPGPRRGCAPIRRAEAARRWKRPWLG